MGFLLYFLADGKERCSFLMNHRYDYHYNTFVLAGGLPSSYLRFFRMAFFFPPVARLLCQLSREIPMHQ